MSPPARVQLPRERSHAQAQCMPTEVGLQRNVPHVASPAVRQLPAVQCGMGLLDAPLMACAPLRAVPRPRRTSASWRIASAIASSASLLCKPLPALPIALRLGRAEPPLLTPAPACSCPPCATRSRNTIATMKKERDDYDEWARIFQYNLKVGDEKGACGAAALPCPVVYCRRARSAAPSPPAGTRVTTLGAQQPLRETAAAALLHPWPSRQSCCHVVGRQPG